jgi:hypothetical protein
MKQSQPERPSRPVRVKCDSCEAEFDYADVFVRDPGGRLVTWYWDRTDHGIVYSLYRRHLNDCSKRPEIPVDVLLRTERELESGKYLSGWVAKGMIDFITDQIVGRPRLPLDDPLSF